MEVTTSHPTFQCLQKHKLPYGETFRMWLKKPENVYISYNLFRYSGDYSAVDEWVDEDLSRDLFCGRISRSGFCIKYEEWLRKERWAVLDTLQNKSVGCWCVNEKSCCVYTVIKKLYHEKKLVNRMFTEGESTIGFT